MSNVRILVADDHELVREAVCARISSHPGWEVCAEAAAGHEAVELIKQHQPDIAVVDISMPGLNGIEVTEQAQRHSPGTEVLILTMQETENIVHRALVAGARGYVLKSDASRMLELAIDTLLKKQPFFTGQIGAVVLERFLNPARPGEDERQSPFDRLTPREREVLQLLAEGDSSKRIARRLSISPHTVEAHRANIMKKLDLHSVAELVRFALRNQVIEP